MTSFRPINITLWALEICKHWRFCLRLEWGESNIRSKTEQMKNEKFRRNYWNRHVPTLSIRIYGLPIVVYTVWYNIWSAAIPNVRDVTQQWRAHCTFADDDDDDNLNLITSATSRQVLSTSPRNTVACGCFNALYRQFWQYLQYVSIAHLSHKSRAKVLSFPDSTSQFWKRANGVGSSASAMNL